MVRMARATRWAKDPRVRVVVLMAGSLVIGGILTLPAPALAADPIPASVRVDAPPSCTTASSFWAALARRTDRLRQARSGEAAASIEITMRPDADGGTATGELRIVRAGATGAASEQRRLTAASCEELTHGMSVVAALAFDPAARLDDGAGDAPVRENAAAPASSAPASAPAPAEAAARPPRDDSPAFRFGAGVSLGGSNVSNELGTPAFGGFADLQHQRGLLTTVRVGFSVSSASVRSDAVGAELGWTLGRVSVCPVRIPLNALASVSVMPCAGLDAGALSAAATGVTRADDRTRFWIAPAATGRFEVQPVRAVFVEAQLGAGFPLIRDEIAVDPTLILYRAPAVVAIGEIGAGVRFP